MQFKARFSKSMWGGPESMRGLSNRGYPLRGGLTTNGLMRKPGGAQSPSPTFQVMLLFSLIVLLVFGARTVHIIATGPAKAADKEFPRHPTRGPRSDAVDEAAAAEGLAAAAEGSADSEGSEAGPAEQEHPEEPEQMEEQDPAQAAKAKKKVSGRKYNASKQEEEEEQEDEEVPDGAEGASDADTSAREAPQQAEGLEERLTSGEAGKEECLKAPKRELIHILSARGTIPKGPKKALCDTIWVVLNLDYAEAQKAQAAAEAEAGVAPRGASVVAQYSTVDECMKAFTKTRLQEIAVEDKSIDGSGSKRQLCESILRVKGKMEGPAEAAAAPEERAPAPAEKKEEEAAEEEGGSKAGKGADRGKLARVRTEDECLKLSKPDVQELARMHFEATTGSKKKICERTMIAIQIAGPGGAAEGGEAGGGGAPAEAPMPAPSASQAADGGSVAEEACVKQYTKAELQAAARAGAMKPSAIRDATTKKALCDLSVVREHLQPKSETASGEEAGSELKEEAEEEEAESGMSVDECVKRFSKKELATMAGEQGSAELGTKRQICSGLNLHKLQFVLDLRGAPDPAPAPAPAPRPAQAGAKGEGPRSEEACMADFTKSQAAQLASLWGVDTTGTKRQICARLVASFRR